MLAASMCCVWGACECTCCNLRAVLDSSWHTHPLQLRMPRRQPSLQKPHPPRMCVQYHGDHGVQHNAKPSTKHSAAHGVNHVSLSSKLLKPSLSDVAKNAVSGRCAVGSVLTYDCRDGLDGRGRGGSAVHEMELLFTRKDRSQLANRSCICESGLGRPRGEGLSCFRHDTVVVSCIDPGHGHLAKGRLS